LAADVDLRSTGILYYVAASSSRLVEALQRLDRYVRVVNEALDLHVRTRPECLVGFSYSGLPRHLDRHMEFCALVLLRLCRQLVGRPVVPVSLKFVHHRSDDLSAMRRALGCLPAFDAAADEMCFEAEVFEAPVVGEDPYLNEIMLADCEAAIANRPSNLNPFRTLVENTIAPLLPHAEARASTIAKQLGLSERTFSRRLQSEGLTFAEILDDLRRDLAVRYLDERNIPISEITWLLGFHQPSALSHACRRWLGKSPREHRRASASQEPI
jgi:AraC-like DNA-binding protein